MRKPFIVFAASAMAAAGAILLAIKLTLNPEEGPKDFPADDENAAPQPVEAADEEEVLVTDEGLKLAAEPFSGEISTPEGVKLTVTDVTPTSIAFTVANSGGKLFYDPHIFPVLQYEHEGCWHELKLNSFPVTRDLLIEELPSRPTGMLLDAGLYYTAVTVPGKYRLVAKVYTSVEAYMNAEEAGRMYLAAEFSI